MNPNNTPEQAKAKFTQAVQHFQDELKKLRTGRAHPSMLDGLMVEAYGTVMPLVQVASVSAPEPQLLQVTPFDPGNLQAISTAIRNQESLGLNPMDDGRVVRVQMPALTEERRSSIVKQLREKTEECQVAMRAHRHEALKDIDQAKKDKSIGEDEAKRLEKQVDDALNQARTQVDAAAKVKEAEIMTV